MVEPPLARATQRPQLGRGFVQEVDQDNWFASLARPLKGGVIREAEIVAQPDDGGGAHGAKRRCQHCKRAGNGKTGHRGEWPVLFPLHQECYCNHIHESCHSKQLTMERIYNEMVTVSSYRFVTKKSRSLRD